MGRGNATCELLLLSPLFNILINGINLVNNLEKIWSVLFSGIWFVSWPAVNFHAVFVVFCSICSSTVVVEALGLSLSRSIPQCMCCFTMC